MVKYIRFNLQIRVLGVLEKYYANTACTNLLEMKESSYQSKI